MGEAARSDLNKSGADFQQLVGRVAALSYLNRDRAALIQLDSNPAKLRADAGESAFRRNAS
jgi:hypothetical protein